MVPIIFVTAAIPGGCRYTLLTDTYHMVFFWILWAVNAIITLIFLYFFFEGLGDGSVGPANMGLWMLILTGLGALLAGSYWLQMHQNGVLAIVLLAVPAIPGLLYGLFMIIVLLTNPRWN
ncbi:osmoprotectant transporter permease [Spirosoma sp. KNUC1025]|uniref:osmoprotectant transporter permease n=1 Tax=Spirosoma sp. KNUC1025 TaxID=2894082 RepID=UPI00386932C9|nr:osmoprotectant transporter permease [Spirosoma sp. KNUC1025]